MLFRRRKKDEDVKIENLIDSYEQIERFRLNKLNFDQSQYNIQK